MSRGSAFKKLKPSSPPSAPIPGGVVGDKEHIGNDSWELRFVAANLASPGLLEVCEDPNSGPDVQSVRHSRPARALLRPRPPRGPQGNLGGSRGAQDPYPRGDPAFQHPHRGPAVMLAP